MLTKARAKASGQIFDRSKIPVVIYLILFSVIVSGCGSSEFDRKFLQQVEDTKKQSTASDIKRIAINYFSQTNKLLPNLNYTGFHYAAPIPTEITSLAIFSEDPPEDVMPISYQQTGTDVVGFDVGGGFAHQGIFICPANSPSEQEFLKKFVGTMIPWEDGVYFWADWPVGGVPRKFWNEQ